MKKWFYYLDYNITNYHTIENVEFSGVLDRCKIYGYIGDYGTPETFARVVKLVS